VSLLQPRDSICILVQCTPQTQLLNNLIGNTRFSILPLSTMREQHLPPILHLVLKMAFVCSDYLSSSCLFGFNTLLNISFLHIPTELHLCHLQQQIQSFPTPCCAKRCTLQPITHLGVTTFRGTLTKVSCCCLHEISSSSSSYQTEFLLISIKGMIVLPQLWYNSPSPLAPQMTNALWMVQYGFSMLHLIFHVSMFIWM
jgi:hypothetical protein